MAEITDYLNGLDEQSVQSEKESLVVGNPVVDELCRMYEAWLKIDRIMSPGDSWENFYGKTLTFFKANPFTSIDIKNFFGALKKYELGDDFVISGFFLSALINTCADDHFEIMTEHFSKKIRFLGYRNEKNVTVRGDLARHIGCRIIKGSLEVKGMVKSDVGRHMEGGILTIEGNLEEGHCGEEMKGGKIIVNGDASRSIIGANSENGEIHFNGNLDIDCFGSYDGAKIYHKGELIWPR